ncbi:PHP domain-containing protein [Natroniella sp. ANB-PHB2]|uniref:PHP domain-containing protein n=1 Tax=Natroniella sp. ANB-PHB2 TaxID=3384444 RepID=UPI0038D3A6E5
MKKIDMHLHTTVSDGSFTPSEVVKEAKRKGLKAIAITDHYNVGRGICVEVISGIELTTYYQGKRIDILGYCIDYRNDKLLNIIKKLQNSRELRGKEILNKL